MKQVALFRVQAEACARLGSPMYASLMHRMADDLEAGGPMVAVLAGYLDASGPSALGLRLLGSVHRLVLDRRAGRLATFYPSVGGTWDPDGGWTALRDLLAAQPDAVREWLDRPPQTNEVGRAGALMGGLLAIDEPLRHPVRLFEIGSSGGLNLLADRFAYVDDAGTTYGDQGSPVVLSGAWAGRTREPWPELRVVERLGSDVMPVDVTTTEGRMTLTAYVWPDQVARFERLRAALDLARRVGVEVRRQDAVSFVGEIDLEEGTTTVLWHSVMWQYLTPAEQAAVTARVASLGADASADAPFAHVFLEPTRRTAGGEHDFLVVLEAWPAGGRRILGTSVGHGLPTTWE